MALPTLDATFASLADLPRRQMLAKWLVEELGSGAIANYWMLPERYLWAKIAVAAGTLKTEADYISLPKRYVWSDIYNTIAGSSGSHIDWSEKEALGHIAAAYRGDTGNPANLATYIDWPWRYQVAAIIGGITSAECADNVAGILIDGRSLYRLGDNAYYNLEYAIYLTETNWIYTQIGIADLAIVQKVNNYPWQDGLGAKDCSIITPNVVVSDAGSTEVNGIYVFSGELYGKPYYSYGDYTIKFDENVWKIYDNINLQNIYISEDTTFFPWDATNWYANNGQPPAPTLIPTNV